MFSHPQNVSILEDSVAFDIFLLFPYIAVIFFYSNKYLTDNKFTVYITCIVFFWFLEQHNFIVFYIWLYSSDESAEFSTCI